MDKRANKKTPAELREYLQWRRRGSRVEPRKGKGSYDRKKFKRGGLYA